MESWLAARQGDVESADFGDSIDQAEDMIKKHDDFKQMLSAQEDKVTNLGKDPSLVQAKQLADKKNKEAKEKEDKQRLDVLKKKEKEKLQQGERVCACCFFLCDDETGAFFGEGIHTQNRMRKYDIETLQKNR